MIINLEMIHFIHRYKTSFHFRKKKRIIILLKGIELFYTIYSEIMDSGEFPLNRTLILISFDHEIEKKTMMKIFSLNGKVRRVFTGNMRVRTSDLDQEDEK